MPKVKKETRHRSKNDPYARRKAAAIPLAQEVKQGAQENGSKSVKDGKRPLNYLFHCAMVCSSNPTITRMLSVPSTFTFEDMHLVMQVAFGWASSHSWHFEVKRLYATEQEQRSGWETHEIMPLLSFMNDPQLMIDVVPEAVDTYKSAAEWKLSDIFENDEYRSKVELNYEYDHGDSWEHLITFLGVEDPGLRKAFMPDAEYNTPLCFAGEGHPCAEDCGGEPGWEDLKKLFTKPRSRDSDDRKGWYKNICLNGDPRGLDPYKWDIVDINDNLERIKK